MLNFAERPVLIPLYLPSERADAGAFVQLTCIVASGDLPLSFQWSFNGNPLDTGDTSVAISRVSPQMSLLVLSAVSLGQAGNYTCHVSNQAGSTSSSIHVKVNGNHRLTITNHHQSFFYLVIYIFFCFNCTNFRFKLAITTLQAFVSCSQYFPLAVMKDIDKAKEKGRERKRERDLFQHSNLVDKEFKKKAATRSVSHPFPISSPSWPPNIHHLFLTSILLFTLSYLSQLFFGSDTFQKNRSVEQITKKWKTKQNKRKKQ